jgi:hypothetical protein
MLSDCASYLDGTIYNLEQKVTDFSEDEDLIQADSQEGSMGEVSNNLEGEWQGLSPADQVKKFNVSSKLFKLRYLCKYHL